jgi:tRNA threonylcarbamoyl adenosine modification protein YjeE
MESGDSKAPADPLAIALPDAAATARLGIALAGALRAGDVVALIGDLGAGKTTLVDACVRALGGEGAQSPTFALIHEYPCGGDDDEPRSLWHLDLYRIEREAELAELGLEEILGNRAGIAFVEWADKHREVLPRAYLRLTLQHAGDGRQAELLGVGGRGQALVTSVAEALGEAPAAAPAAAPEGIE